MFSGIKNAVIKNYLGKLSNDHKTTVLGIALGALQASQVDFVKLMGGDHTEIIKAAGAVFMAVLGYYINKMDPPKPPEAK